MKTIPAKNVIDFLFSGPLCAFKQNCILKRSLVSYGIFWLYPHYHAQFARQKLMNRNFEINCRTMKAAGNRRCIITLRFSEIRSRVTSNANKDVTQTKKLGHHTT